MSTKHPWVEHGKEKVVVEGKYGSAQKLPLFQIAQSIFDEIGHDNVPAFIKSLEAYCEDWEICEGLAFHFMGQVISLFIECGYKDEDPEYYGEFKQKLRELLDKLED